MKLDKNGKIDAKLRVNKLRKALFSKKAQKGGGKAERFVPFPPAEWEGVQFLASKNASITRAQGGNLIFWNKLPKRRGVGSPFTGRGKRLKKRGDPLVTSKKRIYLGTTSF